MYLKKFGLADIYLENNLALKLCLSSKGSSWSGHVVININNLFDNDALVKTISHTKK